MAIISGWGLCCKLVRTSLLVIAWPCRMSRVRARSPAQRTHCGALSGGRSARASVGFCADASHSVHENIMSAPLCDTGIQVLLLPDGIQSLDTPTEPEKSPAMHSSQQSPTSPLTFLAGELLRRSFSLLLVFDRLFECCASQPSLCFSAHAHEQ